MPRILDFSDGFETVSEPSQGSVTSNSLKTFVNDAAYVADKGGAAATGDLYFNTTDGDIRRFDGTDWVSTPNSVAARLLESAVPSTPATGEVSLYADVLPSLNYVDDAGDNWRVTATREDDYFLANTSSQSIADSVTTDMVFTNEVHDVGADYDNGTGIWTVPTTGLWLIDAQVTYSINLSSDATFKIFINNIGVAIICNHTDRVPATTGSDDYTTGCQGKKFLTAGQTLKVQTFHDTGSLESISNSIDINNSFEAFLLRRT